MSSTEARRVAENPAAPTSSCPSWCVIRHGVHLGEENWVHTGEPLLMTDGIRAHIVMSVDPDSGIADGPYVLVGTREYTMSEAQELGSAFVAAVVAATPARPGAGASPSTTAETSHQPAARTGDPIPLHPSSHAHLT